MAETAVMRKRTTWVSCIVAVDESDSDKGEETKWRISHGMLEFQRREWVPVEDQKT
jgi:hypothetical protein